jgi:hypothetical protein
MPGLATPKDPIVLSYYGLRTVVGWIGVLLPFVLSLGHFVIFKPLALQPSISDYYYTFMRNIFEGSLCTIGVFLAATYGYDRTDAIAGRIAGAAAIGVAWFPCENPCTPAWVSHAHPVFASALFLTLAFFCLRQFPQSDRVPHRRTAMKQQRNKLYYLFGWTIVACIILCFLCRWDWSGNPFRWYRGLFWFESIAVVSFGIAWLIKGESFLKDEGAPPTPFFIRHTPAAQPIPPAPIP